MFTLKKAFLLLFLTTLVVSQSLHAEPLNPLPNKTYHATGAAFLQRFDQDIRALLSCAKDSQKLVVVAHRGGFAPGHPENALNTIERTIAHIPAIIEVDVVASADGVDYLHHDNQLHRTTNGEGKYDSLTWEQIKQLRLRDNGYTLTNQHPLSLDDMIAATKGRAFVMWDLKAPSSNEGVIDKIKAAGMLNSSLFIAYNHQQATTILAHEPSALVAFGAASEGQLNEIAQSKLDKQPYIALIGDLTRTDEVVTQQHHQGHFLLGSTYYGAQPADAKLTTHTHITELDNAAKNGFQLVVSNRGFGVYSYLKENGLTVEKCGAESNLSAE